MFDEAAFAVFVLVYTGMFLGEIPGFALDRSGVALLGAIVLLAAGSVTVAEAWLSVDVSTLGLLFGLMVVSAQLRLGGFYTEVTRRIAGAQVSAGGLLALVIGAAGGLSAVLANDIVCLAMAPVLVHGIARRGLDPVPYLLGLAAASNVGSAATLIGNPQNMLIGQVLGLSFSTYLLDGVVPAGLGLGVVWLVVWRTYRRRWVREGPVAPGAPSALVSEADAPAFDGWQTLKGLMVVGGLMGAFLFSPWPREAAALAGAGLVLLSRRMGSREMLALVDWHLLVLFFGLFVVNHALAAPGMTRAALAGLSQAGVDLASPPWLFGVTVVLSNLVSNVPAVMLLLPAAEHPQAGAILALASTLAGNLFVVGSIANLIVVEQAARLGVRIGWREHARVGVPVTVMTLIVAAIWLGVRA